MLRILFFIFAESIAGEFKYLFRHGWLMCDIQLVADVFPTEDRAKVVAAITRLFPDVVIDGEDRVVGRSNSVETFSDQLARQKIRAAARKVFLRGTDGETASFKLNKQVATVGKVSFSEEDHPLGDIHVTIRSEYLQGLIDSMAPSFKEGGP
jgi:predicted RNA binding protein with dsRBD fold (UPF0201 family)